MGKHPLFTPITFDLDTIPADDARSADLNRRYFAGRQASSAARVEAGKARAAICFSASEYDRQRRQERASGVVLPTRQRTRKGDVGTEQLREFHPNDPDNPQRKVVRVRANDGLAELLKAGAIDADDHAAGEHYREAYEGVHASGRSADIPRPGSGIQAARTTITDASADALQRLHRLDRIIGPQCLALVKAVAGEGLSIRAIRRGGKSRWLATRKTRIGLGRLARFLAS